jgi:hypothetical protein
VREAASEGFGWRSATRTAEPITLKCRHESKTQMRYADNVPAMTRTSSKISVPRERGHFTQSTHAPSATFRKIRWSEARSRYID